MRAFLSSLSATALLFLVGCGSSAPRPTVQTTSAPVTVERPATDRAALPNPIVPPLDFQSAVANRTRTATGEPGPNYWQQESRYVLTARLEPDEKRLAGTAQITYTNNSPDPLPALYLSLAQNLHAPGVARNEPAEITGGVTLTRVSANGQELTEDNFGGPRYVVSGTQLGILLPQPVLPGASTTLSVGWSFTIPQAGAGGRMGYSEDNLFFLAYWYPQMHVYDDVVGWQIDSFLGQSEFYAGFGDYEVSIEAPEGWIVMSTGSLQNPEAVLSDPVLERLRRAETSDEVLHVVTPEDFGTATRTDSTGYLTWRFTADQVRDVAFSVTKESVWDAARTPVGDLDGDGQTDYTRIDALYRERAPRWAQVARYAQHAITFFSEYTGLPYPYPHMSAVEGADIIGGGMEYPMMTLMGDYNASGDSALYYVTAHELAHMWVPMIVSTDERRYSWMDEGTTSFNENQARMDYFPGINHTLGDQAGYLQIARAGLEGEIMRRSNYHYTNFAYGTASYSKPASVLVALRGVVGDEVFNRTFRTFIERWAYKHPYPWDLWNTFEDASGRDLDWFWHSWYQETWTLDQAVASVMPTDEGTRITIEDLGRVPMPVHLTLTLADGSTLRHDLPVDPWLAGQIRTTVTIPTESSVVRVEIDAEHQFPDADRSNNVWVR